MNSNIFLLKDNKYLSINNKNMKVYTFSTGGCRDGIYLESLSSSKEGVKDLIQSYLSIEDYLVREVKFLLDKIEVNCYDIDLGDTEYKYYDLVSFDVN